jgi:hypothetical protein
MYNQQCQNVLHFLGPTSDPAQMSALADDLAVNWIGVVRARMSSAVRYVAITVRLLESQFPPFTKTLSVFGSQQFDNELDTFKAFVLRLRSAEIGKRGRGRIYVPGVMKGWTTEGIVDDDVQVAWNNNIATLMATYGPGGSSPFRLTICPSKPPFSTREVTSMQVAPTLGIQRRRNIGVGV